MGSNKFSEVVIGQLIVRKKKILMYALIYAKTIENIIIYIIIRKSKFPFYFKSG